MSFRKVFLLFAFLLVTLYPVVQTQVDSSHSLQLAPLLFFSSNFDLGAKLSEGQLRKYISIP